MPTTQVIVSQPWHGKFDRSYVCPLADYVLGVARNELREDESSRDQALQQLRDWLKKNPDVRNVRTDHNFLLRFLRCKKFSVPMAQQTILKYLNLRQTFRHFCYSLDFLDPSINEIIRNGYIFVSPVRDRLGRRVTITIAGNFNAYKFTSADMAKAHLITYETLLEDEETQVMGFTHIGDLKGASTAHITLWSPSDFATLMKWGEQSLPMRHKEIHCLNVPPALRYVYDFARSRFSPKMRDRFMIHDSLKQLHEKVDPRVLPKEYGGTVPMAEMIELWKIELSSKRDRLLSLDKMELLDNKGIITSKNKHNDNSLAVSVTSIAGSFRKLEVD